MLSLSETFLCIYVLEGDHGGRPDKRVIEQLSGTLAERRDLWSHRDYIEMLEVNARMARNRITRKIASVDDASGGRSACACTGFSYRIV